ALPVGSVIVSAELKVTASSKNADPPPAYIFGERVGGSPAHAMRSVPCGPDDVSGASALPGAAGPPAFCAPGPHAVMRTKAMSNRTILRVRRPIRVIGPPHCA